MKPEVIDLTPTWAAVVPILAHAIEHGDAEARAAALEEMRRMADAADKFNALARAHKATAGEG